jgi:uncharacterized protein
MPDFKKMTVERLRELARKVLGPGHSRLKTKEDLVRALEEAKPEPSAPPKGAKAPKAKPAKEPRARPAKEPRKAGPRDAKAGAAAAAGKAVRAARDAGKAARGGAKALVRAGKMAADAATEGARAGTGAVRARKGGKMAKAAAAAVGAVAGLAAAARRGRGAGPPAGLPDPEGFFVARVRGEEAVRDAPHLMAESSADTDLPPFPEGVGGPPYDEGLGEIPWSYGDDAFVVLARDPKTLFAYWDLSPETLDRGLEGLPGARTQLWVFSRGDGGWDRVRTVEFALESRGYYVHDLEPGRTYRVEIHAVSGGAERMIGSPSNEVVLPPVGPSSIVDDRFIRIPWEMSLGRLLGRGHAGVPFSEEARALLARLSDWSRFGPTWGGSAGGMGGRSSPTSSPSAPFGASENGDE